MLYQVVLHLHLSLKGVSTAAKLNIDKNSIDVPRYIETDACGNYVINAKPDLSAITRDDINLSVQETRASH